MAFTKEELEERRNFIGASEAAAALGLSKWTTPTELWAVKTGLIPVEVKESLAAEVGTELEDFIARKYMRETGEKVQRVTEPYIHNTLPFLRCHIDRKIVGKKKILQCKTCSAYKFRDWEEDEIPLDYIIQEYVELACTDYSEADIAVLIGNHDFKIKTIYRDERAIAEMLAKLKTFWYTYVQGKVMPQNITAHDSEVLYKLFPKADPLNTIDLPQEADILLDGIDAMGQDKKQLEMQIEEAKNKVRAFMGTAELGKTATYLVKWANTLTKAYSVPEKQGRRLSHKKIEEGK